MAHPFHYSAPHPFMQQIPQSSQEQQAPLAVEIPKTELAGLCAYLALATKIVELVRVFSNISLYIFDNVTLYFSCSLYLFLSLNLHCYPYHSFFLFELSLFDFIFFLAYCITESKESIFIKNKDVTFPSQNKTSYFFYLFLLNTKNAIRECKC